MDKHLNESEKLIQQWLETKDFESLSDNEKALVLNIMDKNEYQLQYKIISESADLYENESINAVVPPIQVDVSGSSTFWFKSHPIYHTILAVAATVLIMFWIKTPSVFVIKPNGTTQFITQHDTIEIIKEIMDTVIIEKEKPIYLEKIKYVDNTIEYSNNYCPQQQEDRLLEPGITITLPDSKFNSNPTKTNAIKDDPTTSLVFNILLTD
ncbi:MAG: hypothetical protein H6600_08755 [Flavobacteriales bacterium]|nr:hypothetical protein [Flavobacteriales bacterium]MCB9196381.1 hypothetical protein [Flavobacteriales bacterium]MCB9198536.1 hypothetical protein [Flavobacteriales bacterium]